MAIALVAASNVGSGSAGGTTTGIDTTGANLIVAAVSAFNTPITVSDNKGNTFTALTQFGVSTDLVRLYYCLNPTVGSGHTVSVSGASTFSCISLLSFSGVGSFDTQNGATSTTTHTSIQPGSVTPAANGAVLVTVAGGDQLSDPNSIDSSFTISAHAAGDNSTRVGFGAAYLVQSTAAAVNPTWTIAVNATIPGQTSAAIAVFDPSAGGGVSVNVTGVSSTSAVGTSSITGFGNVSVTGVNATSAVGSPTITGFGNVSLTGVAASSSIGSITVAVPANANLPGVSSTSAAGTPTVTGLANVPLTGVESSGQVGTIVASVPTAVSVTLIGVESVAIIGTLTAQDNSTDGQTVLSNHRGAGSFSRKRYKKLLEEEAAERRAILAVQKQERDDKIRVKKEADRVRAAKIRQTPDNDEIVVRPVLIEALADVVADVPFDEEEEEIMLLLMAS